MKSLLAALAAALILAAPVAASGGVEEFTSSGATPTVSVTFTIENNHAYYLSEFDAAGVQVCSASLSRLDANYLGTGTVRTLSCTARSGGAPFSALFQVQHSTNLTPSFSWSS